MGIPPVGSTPDQPSSSGDVSRKPSPGETTPFDASDTPAGQPRASFQHDLPVRGPRDGTIEPASTRATFRQKPRDEALHEYLESLSRSPVVSSIPNRQPGQIKSLETIAADSGVAVDALEDRVRRDMSAFCESVAASRQVDTLKNQPLIDKLYNLYVLSHNPESPSWLSHMRNFDSFMARFCQDATPLAKLGVIHCVESFVRFSLLPSRLFRPDLAINSGEAALPAYDDPGNWIRLNTAWVNTQVIDEARQLVHGDLSIYEKLLTHDTGSPALPKIAESSAIWSAQRSLQHGEELVTGEYAYSAYQQAHTSLQGTRGHNHVYTSRDSLSSRKYTIQRWFDEPPVTFGISTEKQREYDRTHGVTARYIELATEIPVGSEIATGPVVPLDNIVAIAAPKANEAALRAWIEAHCPAARFVSYEAIDLLEYADKKVSEQQAPRHSRGTFDRGFLA